MSTAEIELVQLKARVDWLKRAVWELRGEGGETTTRFDRLPMILYNGDYFRRGGTQVVAALRAKLRPWITGCVRRSPQNK